MTAAFAIALKDLRVLSRDPMALFWALAFPVVFALFFGSIMKVGSDAKRTPIEVVLVARANPAVGATARALRAAGFEVTLAGEAAGRDAVRRGQAALLVDLPAAGEQRAVRLGVDPTRSAEAEMARGALEAVLIRAAAPRTIALPPIETVAITGTRQGPQTGFQAVFPAMVMWGLIGCAAAFAVALVSERSSGTLLRLYAAPVGRGAIVGGKALSCALACMLAIAVLSALGIVLLGVAITDPLKYGAAVLAATACFVGITQLLSVLGRSEQSVAGAGWSVLIVLAMSGGAMVPAVLMPEWLHAISALSPVRWGIVVLEGATFRELDWRELSPALVQLCAAGALGFAVSALVLRRREA